MLSFLNYDKRKVSSWSFFGLIAAAVVFLALPLLRAEDSTPSKSAYGISVEDASGKIFTTTVREQNANSFSEKKLQKKWEALSKKEAAEMTRRHVHGLMRAAHRSHEAHKTLPPAVISNPKLPAGKRLSGLVLLLPYLGADSWIEKDKQCFDEQTVNQARELYKKIDLTKAWDDPVNLKAAKSIIPAFLAPQSGAFRDKQGFAVSHFAFVRGCDGKENGAFPVENGIKISDIKDGTVSTLGFGQISNSLGPWMAEGFSTARQLVHPPDGQTPTFGGPYKEGCFFANCDSYAYFLDLKRSPTEALFVLTTRSESADGNESFFAAEKAVRSKLPPGIEVESDNRK